MFDEQVVISGSSTYTEPATTLDDESIVVLGDREEEDPQAQAAQRDLARYALDEIERIASALSAPL